MMQTFPFNTPERFSQSPIWQLQRDYYEDKGIDAWRHGEVPHYITSNPVIGKAYAALALAFLEDLARKGQAKETVYIIELGAGHGRFCYHFLRHFIPLVENHPSPLPPFCYVLSDLAERNLHFCAEHARLAEFREKGLLDFAVFDATSDTEIFLQDAGITLKPGACAQPLIALGNYFFDTLPQELFYVEGRTLYDTYISFTAEAGGKKEQLLPAELIRLLRLKYEDRKQEAAAFPEAGWNDLLETYRSLPDKSYILFPYAGLRCIERLRNLSQQGLFLVTADKGFHRYEEAGQATPPPLVKHGSFSLYVNYHAIKVYCQQEGAAFFPRHYTPSLVTGALLFLRQAETFAGTAQAYAQSIAQFGPEDFYNVRKLIERMNGPTSFVEIMSVLRMSGYDTATFQMLLSDFHRVLPGMSAAERLAVFQAVQLVWESYYPLGEQSDLALEIARLLLQLKFHKEALVFIGLSEKIYGITKANLQARVLGYVEMGDYKAAQELLETQQVEERS